MKINDILYSLQSLYPENYDVKVKVSGRTAKFTAKSDKCIAQNPLTIILAKNTSDYDNYDESNLEAILTRVKDNNCVYMHRNLAEAFDRIKYGRNLFETPKQKSHDEECYFRLKIRNAISGNFRSIARSSSIDELYNKIKFLRSIGDKSEFSIKRHRKKTYGLYLCAKYSECQEEIL